MSAASFTTDAVVPRFDVVAAMGMALGAVLAMSLPAAPSRVFIVMALILALSGWWRWPRLRFVLALLAGGAWALLIAVGVMQARLPASLEGEPLLLQGRVQGLPQEGKDQTRFRFLVIEGEGAAQVLQGKTVQLAWYRHAEAPEPGSLWRLNVQLKRPRGTLNPGGQDFERRALEQRIAATGYVREGPENQPLTSGGGINALRASLSEAIAQAVNAPRARFVQALAVGDTRGLDGDDWHVLRATGIAHLVAISGLHIGIAAGFGALLTRWLYRFRPRLGLRLPLPQGAAMAALIMAALYAALAGFSLPTVRALLMIATALLAILLRRAFHPMQAFALALMGVLIFDPLAVLNAGFWLSFLGVAWLLGCLPTGERQSWWRALGSMQEVLSIGLLPLTVWFFGQASVAGPLCNLLAVPWASLLVVPVALLGTLLELCWTGAGAWLFQLSAWLMQGLWQVMTPVAGWHGAMVYLPEATATALVLALAGAWWLLLPRGFPGKPLAVLLFLPLLFPRLSQPAVDGVLVDVLDVGQGLSVLIRTQDHAALIDAGPAFPGGMDMGEAAVVPALRALGVTHLDLFIVSHGDNDHAGGAAAVKRAYAPERTLVSRRQPEKDEETCLVGEAWQWGRITLRTLHPPEWFPYLKNESSCVLRVEVDGKGLVLLPGDIGYLIEQRLVREQSESLPANVLIMPHHGSRTSSSEVFIDAVSPRLALIGAGYRNRFGLPREDILQRYQQREIAVLNTAEAGALQVSVTAEGIPEVRSARQTRAALWREHGE